MGIRKLIAGILLAALFITGCVPLVSAATDALNDKIEQVRKYRSEKGREIESIQREIAGLQREIDPKIYDDLRVQLDQIQSDSWFEKAAKYVFSLGHISTAEKQVVDALEKYGEKYQTYPALIAAKEAEIQTIQNEINQYSKQQGDAIYRTVWSDYVNAKNAMNIADQAYNQAKGTNLEWAKQKEANEATQRFNLAEDNLNKIKGYYKEWTGQDPPALSETPAAGVGQVVQPGQLSTPGQPPSTSTYLQDVDKDKRTTASFPERLFGNLFSGIPQALASILGLADPMQLVFFNAFPGTNQQGGSDLWLNIFTPTEKSVVASVYSAFEGLIPTFLVIATVVAGSALLIGTMGSEKRLGAKQYIQGILIAVLMLKFGPLLMTIVADINQFFVHFMGSMMSAQGIDLTQGFISQFFPDGSVSIAAIILGLLGILMIGLLNFHYVVRKVCLAVLIMLLPVTAFMSIFKKGLIDLWIKEFASNVFLQLGHAVTIAFFFLAFNRAENFFVLIVMLMSLGGVADLVRNLFGVGHEGHGALSLAAGLVGAQHLLGIGQIIGQTIGGHKQQGTTGLAEEAGRESSRALSGTGDMAALIKPIRQTAGYERKARVVRGTGAALGGVAGAMIGGAIGGQAGIAAGAAIGAEGVASGILSGERMLNNVREAKFTADEEGIDFGTAFKEKIGLHHRGQWAVPGEAAKIGRQLLGGEGLAGSLGSLGGRAVGMAAMAFDIVTPGQSHFIKARAAIKGIEGEYRSARRGLNGMLENVYAGREDKSPLSYQQHLAQFAAIRAQYGPGSTAWIDLKAQAANAKAAYHEFTENKNDYISYYATKELGEAAYTAEVDRLMQDYRSAEQAAMYGPTEWRDALEEHEAIEATIRQHQIDVMQAQSRMSKHSQELASVFSQLNQHRVPIASGTVNDII